MNILSFLIPTNRPESLNSDFISCLPVFKPLQKYITFCFNFQPPYTQEMIDEFVGKMREDGFRVEYCVNDYKFTPETFSFIKMRDDAAQVAPKDTLYFVDYDDDILYFEESTELATKIWIQAIDYLLKNPRMGSLRIDSRMTTQVPREYKVVRNRIYPQLVASVRTGLGLIYKNIYDGHVLPKEQLSLLGSHEDNLEIFQRVLDGYLTAFVINAAIGDHTDSYDIKSRVRYGLAEHEDEEGSVWKWVEKILPYCMNNYPLPNLFHEWSKQYTELVVKCTVDELLVALECTIDNYIDVIMNGPQEGREIQTANEGQVIHELAAKVIDDSVIDW